MKLVVSVFLVVLGIAIAYDSVMPNDRAALSPDVAAKYNLQPGERFTVTTANGQTCNLLYADKTWQSSNATPTPTPKE